jgi:hypothetical protein
MWVLTDQETPYTCMFLVKFIQFGTLGIDTCCFEQYVKFAGCIMQVYPFPESAILFALAYVHLEYKFRINPLLIPGITRSSHLCGLDM